MDRKPMNNSTVNKCRTRELVQTEDGSFTFFIPEANETYHSIHGADQEASHVFIQYGLKACPNANVKILEVGMGTGLNVLLTFLQKDQPVHYVSLEPFPIERDKLDTWIASRVDDVDLIRQIHDSPWGLDTELSKAFLFRKEQLGIMDFHSEEKFNVIYFDAFGPQVEPELWTLEVMQRCYELLEPGGIWVSYCAKGQVRRNLQEVGFKVERLPGPPGKREMLRAIK
jgi:tRNA U34 5-methylaminomethyl-2-thiouridine-forming methyltransferase MnmC